MEDKELRKVVLKMLKNSKKPIWESDISKKTRVSFSKISEITKEFADLGLIKEVR